MILLAFFCAVLLVLWLHAESRARQERRREQVRVPDAAPRRRRTMHD